MTILFLPSLQFRQLFSGIQHARESKSSSGVMICRHCTCCMWKKQKGGGKGKVSQPPSRFPNTGAISAERPSQQCHLRCNNLPWNESLGWFCTARRYGHYGRFSDDFWGRSPSWIHTTSERLWVIMSVSGSSGKDHTFWHNRQWIIDALLIFTPNFFYWLQSHD